MRTVLIQVTVCAALFVFTAQGVTAQARTQVYGVAGAGPAVLAGGVDWLIGGSPVGLQAEAGLFALSLGPSYHFGDRRSSRRLDVFATAGYLSFTDLNYEDVGVRIGGGIVYWTQRHIGVRLDAYGFAPVEDRIRTPHHHWGLQGGIAYSFRSVGGPGGGTAKVIGGLPGVAAASTVPTGLTRGESPGANGFHAGCERLCPARAPS